MNALFINVVTIILTKYGISGVLNFTTDLLNEVTTPKK